MRDFVDSYLKINGEESTHYGLYISGSGTYYAPKKRREVIDVPGRNGSLIIEDGAYDNAPHVYKALIINYENNIEKVRNWFESLRGYFRLEDSYHPNEFLIASFEGPFDPEVWRDGSVAKFDLKFDRKPQRFLKTGEVTTQFTSNGSIENPTRFNSKPLIRIYGNGTVGLGDKNIVVSGNTEPYVDVDCEIMDCFKGALNLNDKVSLTEFPVLKSGSNGVSLGTGITKVEITPRWWIL